MKSDLIRINRKTSGILDVLSAAGGLMRSLNAIAMVLINPYTLYGLQSYLAQSLVRIIPSSRPAQKDKKAAKK